MPKSHLQMAGGILTRSRELKETGNSTHRRSRAQTFDLRLLVLALASTALLVFAMAFQARAEGPASVADLAERLSSAVVNISTAQNVSGDRAVPLPNLPPGSPFQEFFEEFLERQQRGNQPQRPRKVQSLHAWNRRPS